MWRIISMHMLLLCHLSALTSSSSFETPSASCPNRIVKAMWLTQYLLVCAAQKVSKLYLPCRWKRASVFKISAHLQQWLLVELIWLYYILLHHITSIDLDLWWFIASQCFFTPATQHATQCHQYRRRAFNSASLPGAFKAVARSSRTKGGATCCQPRCGKFFEMFTPQVGKFPSKPPRFGKNPTFWRVFCIHEQP